MNIEKYKEKCLLTWSSQIFKGDWEKDRIKYLENGLFIEAVEVFDLFNKQLRDGGKVDREALKKELGDVLWFILVAHHENILFGNIYPKPEQNLDYNLYTDLGLSYHIYMLLSGGTFIEAEAVRPVIAIQALASRYNLTLPEIMEANISKLEDRLKRGKIGGSGNDR